MNQMTNPARGKMVNSFDPNQLSGIDDVRRSMIERRGKLLGPAYRLFYQNPVEVSRGQGAYLYDRDGKEYLDAYNNVVSVGHCHPRVVEAIAKQAATLCTHTRYLQEGILSYADDLLTTFGGDVGHVMFTCTGSEANDLAMRIAKNRTGRHGIIITDEAYHGNSDLTSSFSPSLGRNSPLGTWVRRVPAPDSYRLSKAEVAQQFIDNVAKQIEDLERHGDGVAAFIADSLFSSDGVYSDPTDFLAPVADMVRKAGGLYVADEVQSGFARSGDRFWGYQRHALTPDIVTMGKPMGNGFPVAAVAIKPEVIEQFGHGQRYFNTFGGNTVAIAAAQATLDVIRDEGLQENSARIGKMLRDGFEEMAKRFEFIGDVRGAGLFLGVEIVSDRKAKTPDAQRATAIVNGLRERRVLISATGANANSLKIRPPLIFTAQDAGRLLAETEAVFKAI